jgi:hypothetical protein
MVILRGGVLLSLVIFPHRLQFGRSIEGIVGIPLFDQFLCVGPIGRFSFALAVGTEGAAVLYAFIGFEPAPTQAIENIFFRSGHISALVGVFDPDNEIASVFFGKEVVVENGTNTAEV